MRYRYSSESDISDIVKLLKTVDSQSYHLIDKQVKNFFVELWLHIDNQKGISLREREKMLPVFEEMSRIFKPYETTYSKVYRGVVVPSDMNIKEQEVLEGLAYGLRSWSHDMYVASSFTDDDFDSLIYVYKNPDVVFDCDSYFKYKRTDLAMGFDMTEVLVYMRDPKLVSVKKIQPRKWLVEVM